MAKIVLRRTLQSHNRSTYQNKNRMDKQQTPHIPYFDFLRGIAILMVVGIHTFQLGSESDLGFEFKQLLFDFTMCAVPLFIALSGYFIGKKYLSTRHKVNAFWKKQLKAMYTPCLIYRIWHKLISLSRKRVITHIEPPNFLHFYN